MPSKSESARINGAKSHGPTTEAGRRRSSQNALKHGFSAQTIVLPTEDPSEFNQLLADYTNHLQPDGPIELDLVHQMVAAKWRLRRLSTIETQLFAKAIETEVEYADEDEDQEPLTPTESLAEAFSFLANRKALDFLHRAESRLERSYSRALRQLLQLQHLRQPRLDPPPSRPPENKICKNEPTAHVKSIATSRMTNLVGEILTSNPLALGINTRYAGVEMMGTGHIYRSEANKRRNNLESGISSIGFVRVDDV